MRAFNEGLEASDFRYFIASGKSRAQLDRYSVDSFKFALDVLNYTNDHKADSAVVMNRRWKSEVLGLAFNTHAAPQGWRDAPLNTKAPSDFLELSDFGNLTLLHPHSYLGAIPHEPGNKYIAPVARPVLDKWVIASPIRGDKTFIPEDAIEIDAATYATITGQKPGAVQSPATDPEYQNAYLDAYPFKAKTTAPAPATA